MKSITEYREKFSGAYPASGEGSRRAKAFELALQIRDFEIELYWKRATYFWTLIASAFIAFGVIASAKIAFEPRQSELLVAFACLGLSLSFSWFCINRGSKFWQENWENHVDLLEDSVLGPIYKTVLQGQEEKWPKKLTTGFPFSVSRINSLISLLMTAFWLFLIALYSFPDGFHGKIDCWKVFSVLVAVAYCGFLYCSGGRSQLGSSESLSGSKLRVFNRTV